MNETRKNTTNGGVVTTAAYELYDESVKQRMVGRCGAYTQTGSKGIAHEIMAVDKKNMSSLTKPDTFTKLTLSPNARQVDAVTTKAGKVVERIQYKDVTSKSGINKLTKQIESGKYQQVQVHATEEASKMLDSALKKNGIKKPVHSTGISSVDTTRVADKFLGNTPKLVTAGNLAMKTSAVSAGIAAVTEGVKAIIDGDSVGDGTKRIVSKSMEAGVTAAASTVAAELIMATAGTILTATNPLVITGGLLTTLLVGNAASELTEGVFDGIGECVGDIVEGISDFASDIGSSIEDFFQRIFYF